MKVSSATGLTMLSLALAPLVSGMCCRTTIDISDFANMCDDGFVPGATQCCGIGSCNIFCCNCDDDKCRRSTDCAEDCSKSLNECAAQPGHAFDTCEEAYGSCMQVCGSRHPDHYKRSLNSRDGPANASATDMMGDLNYCLSQFTAVSSGKNNISMAEWEFYALSQLVTDKQTFASFNVSDSLMAWIAKFENWDTNGDGVLTWAEANTVKSWSWS